MTTYKIVRMYRDHPGKDTDGLPTGLTLEQAQAWCHDPETSSSTATSRAARAVTDALGPWFDGYEAEADTTTPEQPEPLRVEKLSWRRNGPQLWHDDWRNADRVCRFMGNCIECGRRTYAFDDGENDPRGVLGDRAASPLVAEDFDMTGPDVPFCFLCENDYENYTHGVAKAKRAWTDPA